MGAARMSTRALRVALVVAVATAALIVPRDVALAAEGDLDPIFGTDGIQVTDLGMGNNPGYAMAVDGQDRILVAGAAHNGTNLDAFVARYSADGVLDPTFGQGGVVMLGFGSRNRRSFDDDQAFAMGIQADQRIVIAGSVLGASRVGFSFALARLGPDGSLDPTFGEGGKVVTRNGGVIADLAFTADGSIVVAGTTGGDIALARYRTSGVLDRSFGKRGVVTDDWGSFQEYASAVTVDGQGRILVAGTGLVATAPATWGFSVARYTEQGARDRTFGTRGLTSLDLERGGKAQDLTMHDGKTLVAGSVDHEGGFPDDFLLARLTDDGALDPTFGQGGLTTTSFADASLDVALAVTLDEAGDIVAAGSSGDGQKDRATLARYMPDGTLDASFGTAGRVITDLPGNAYNLDVVLQSTGRIVAGGRTQKVSSLRRGDLAAERVRRDGRRSLTGQLMQPDVLFLVGYEGSVPPPMPVPPKALTTVDDIIGSLTRARKAAEDGATDVVGSGLNEAHGHKAAVIGARLGMVCRRTFLGWYTDLYAIDQRLHEYLDLRTFSDPRREGVISRMRSSAAGILEGLKQEGCLTNPAENDLEEMDGRLGDAIAKVRGIKGGLRHYKADDRRRQEIEALLREAKDFKEHLICRSGAFPPVLGVAFCLWYASLEELDLAIDDARYYLRAGRVRLDLVRGYIDEAMQASERLKATLQAVDT